MKHIGIMPLVSLFTLIICHHSSINKANPNKGILDQVRETAIQDFSKTKLFKMDSVFDVTVYDTLNRIGEQRIDKQNVKTVVDKTYTEIVAVDIGATPFKFLLDTDLKVQAQNKWIPSRVFEKDGRLFLWRDKNFPLTDSTIKILDRFHLVVRGSKRDYYRFLDFGFDDSKRAAHYFFCRKNPSVHKRVITNKGMGYYDPPNISCK